MARRAALPLRALRRASASPEKNPQSAITMRGRKPKPTVLKLLQGNAGHRKLDPAAEPQPTPGVPECPSYLPPYAKEIWYAEAPELARMHTLTLPDVQIFLNYCSQAGKVRSAMERQAEFTAALARETGAKKRFLLVQQLQGAEKAEREAARLVDKFAVQLGIGASNRSRIKRPADDGQTELPLGEGAFAAATRLAHGA